MHIESNVSHNTNNFSYIERKASVVEGGCDVAFSSIKWVASKMDIVNSL